MNSIPVLTYHSVNVIRNIYAENDHIALASDLRTLTSLGWQVRPLRDVAAWCASNDVLPGASRVVGLSCDDGSWFDFYDLDHPTCGMQRSFLNILEDFRSECGDEQPNLHMTSFVIASPQARDELDRKGLIGKGWWGDEWWVEAESSGLMEIACHSWDHVHPDLDRVVQRNQEKGNFNRVNSFEDCDAQVRRAGDYIAGRLGGKRPTLYAYPWGQASAYIRDEYLPNHCERHGFEAAFTTDPKPVEKSDSRWTLPRYVFGRDWRSPQELEQLLSSVN
ncbi:MAG: polysaccharide deacetylase family protein [Xanthomonadales bacterium]|nr:polysaccharide deacetylase family protein [Xanthomonadales bacterium]